MKSGIHYDLPFKDYRNAIGMNASKLKTLYSDDYDRLNNPISDQTKRDAALRMGTIAHLALLEPDQMLADERVLPELNLRTKADKSIRDAHIEKYGEYDFLYFEEAEKIKGMGAALRSKPGSDVAAMLQAMESGVLRSEASAFAEMEGRKVKCRFDLIGGGMGLDYKSTVSANPKDFVKNAINLGYDLQAAWYMDCYKAATGEDLDSFVFLAQEKTPNYLFSLVEFNADSIFIEKGRDKYLKALARYDTYKESGLTSYDGHVLNGEDLLPGWYQ